MFGSGGKCRKLRVFDTSGFREVRSTDVGPIWICNSVGVRRRSDIESQYDERTFVAHVSLRNKTGSIDIRTADIRSR